MSCSIILPKGDDMNNKSNFSRREFITSSMAATAALSMGVVSLAGQEQHQFKLKYAPNLGMFKQHAGNDPIDQIKFIHDVGFQAVFDNNIMRREVDVQDKIARELANRNMELGPFVLYADFGVKSFVTRDPEIRQMLTDLMQQGVETAQRINAKWALVVPGRFDEGLEWDYQTANVIDNLKRCCEILEPAGLIMVLEPLNAWTNLVTNVLYIL